MGKDFRNGTTLTNIEAASEAKESKPGKKSPGRPKKYDEPSKGISIKLPEELLNQYKEVQGVCGSMREYITRLIKEDMEAHYEEYKEMAKRFR